MKLLSSVVEFSISVGDIYFPWVAVYLWNKTLLNLIYIACAFLDSLADSVLHRLVLSWEDLSFNISFDRGSLKSFDYWLGLLMLARCITVSNMKLCLCGILSSPPLTDQGSQELLFAISFVAQILMAAGFTVGTCYLCLLNFIHNLMWGFIVL